MIPQTDRRVRKHAIPELKADPAEYRRLLEDLIQSSGSLIPDPNWLAVEEVSQPAETYDKGKALERAVSRQYYLDRISKMESLMFSWVGGSERPSQTAISKYHRFLRHCDVLDLWKCNMEADSTPLLGQDLGTLMDLNLIYAYAASPDRRVTRILEVGGGYGRLAEAAFNVFGRSVQ